MSKEMRFRKKTKKLLTFMGNLEKFTKSHPEVKRLKLEGLKEKHLQIAFRSILVDFLEGYFRDCGYVDPNAKAHRELYWEGQLGSFANTPEEVFTARNYPDYIFSKPYKIAIEYKQSKYGSLVKQGIGQAVMHTISGEYDFAVVLFHDKSKGRKIQQAAKKPTERQIIDELRSEFNVFLMFV